MPGLGQRKTEGHRISDTLSFAVFTKFIPSSKINEVLDKTKRKSSRKRLLPAQLMIYYIIALSFYYQSSSREVLRYLIGSIQDVFPEDGKFCTACKSAISQARIRLGSEPLVILYNELVMQIATIFTKGAFYKNMKLVAMDGSSIEVCDTKENLIFFGKSRYGRKGGFVGEGGYPRLRFLSLVEVGTHVAFETVWDKFSTSEIELGKKIINKMKPGMLVMADRLFFNYEMWKLGLKQNTDLLWRIKNNTKLDIIEELSDGSYIAKVYPSRRTKKDMQKGITLRVIEYTIKGKKDPYRLVTTLLDHKIAPALELAELYNRRWVVETVYDEIKNHIRDKKIILKSKKPDLVIQEFYGLLLAHFTIRGIMHEAALQAELPPDRLSFTHSVRVVRRKLKGFSGFSPSKTFKTSQSNNKRNSRGVSSQKKRKVKPKGGKEKGELLQSC